MLVNWLLAAAPIGVLAGVYLNEYARDNWFNRLINLAVINLEKKLWEMEGLEDLYSMAGNGFAVVTAKFKVGENLETSLFKVYSKTFSNIDQVPSGVTGWVVKPMSINDVPMVTLTLFSRQADDYELRRVADELLHRLQAIPDAGRAAVVAGRRRLRSVGAAGDIHGGQQSRQLVHPRCGRRSVGGLRPPGFQPSLYHRLFVERGG